MTQNRSSDFNSNTPWTRPQTRLLASGAAWRVSEYICTAGPSDRPFEEQHEHMTIAAVLEGSFNYRSSAGRAALHPGALLLGNAGACFTCGHDHGRGDRCVAFHFTSELFAEVAASAAASDRFRFPVAMLPALPALLPWLARIETAAAHGGQAAAEDMVLRFLESVVAIAAGSPPLRAQTSLRDEHRICDVIQYVVLNAGVAIDLDAMALRSDMSKYHFLRTFRHVTGVTPYQFLLGIRMRHAAVCIATTSEPIIAIAFNAGFGDLSTFNKRFRRTFGMSPTTYRARERHV